MYAYERTWLIMRLEFEGPWEQQLGEAGGPGGHAFLHTSLQVFSVSNEMKPYDRLRTQ